jgi:hypothetical protein
MTGVSISALPVLLVHLVAVPPPAHMVSKHVLDHVVEIESLAFNSVEVGQFDHPRHHRHVELVHQLAVVVDRSEPLRGLLVRDGDHDNQLVAHLVSEPGWRARSR